MDDMMDKVQGTNPSCMYLIPQKDYIDCELLFITLLLPCYLCISCYLLTFLMYGLGDAFGTILGVGPQSRQCWLG